MQGTIIPLIKIGIASDMYDRIKSMQTGSPDKLKIILLIGGSKDAEIKIQARFEYLRRHGEWFAPEKELLDYIEDLKPYAVYRDEY